MQIIIAAIWTVLALVMGALYGYAVGLKHGRRASNDIERHHILERNLLRLRRLRDYGDPSFKPEAEDAILDEMESIWNRLNIEDRGRLEVQRSGHQSDER